MQFEAVSLARRYSNALFSRSSVDAEVYDCARTLLHEYPEFAIDMALSSSYGLVPASATTRGITFDGNVKGGNGSGAVAAPWHSYRIDEGDAR